VLQALSRPTAPSAGAFPQLTAREREVLEHVATGRNNVTISRHLSLSAHTVANHVSSILMKLQAADRAEAIIRARDAGLGKNPGR
jgi:DNA-binding NarL/FixJ family response regulator